MASFTFSNFEIKGPPGLTFEQAKAIFDKQFKSGSLVGFKPGDVLSAATQASAGLDAAQAALTQAQNGIPALPGAFNQASAAIAQVGGSLNGIVSSVPGISGAGGLATAGFSSQLNQTGSLAKTAIQTINSVVSKVSVTNPITASDFATTLPALSNMGNMPLPSVTASMASVKNLVNQSVSAISNANGVGSFGLDVSQLEKAGVVKPGTSALLGAGAATVASVLKSPAVFTGKSGINNLQDLVSNPQVQSTIQQGLMATGLKELNSLGIPVNLLSAPALSGVSSIAAKSVEKAAAYLNNLPIPGDAAGQIKNAFDKTLRDGAFASNLAENKLPPAWKAEEIPVPAEDTVNRETLDAASQRIVGNDKVPTLNYGPAPAANPQSQLAQIQSALREVVAAINQRAVNYANIGEKVSALQNQQSLTQAEWDAIQAEYAQQRSEYNNVDVPKLADLVTLRENSAALAQAVTRADFATLDSGVETLVSRSRELRERIRQLTAKIQGTSNT